MSVNKGEIMTQKGSEYGGELDEEPAEQLKEPILDVFEPDDDLNPPVPISY